MPGITYSQVWSDHTISAGTPGETTTVTLLSGDTVYFGDPNVTASSNFGSLTVGGSVTLTNPVEWFRSAGKSFVQISGVKTPASPYAGYPASYIKVPTGQPLSQALAGWYAAKANNSTTPAVIAYIGDSIVGGYNLSDGITNGYPNRIKQMFQAAGYTWYGEGYTMAPYALNPQQIANVRWGNWLGGANGHQLDAGLQRVIYDASTTGSALSNVVIPTGAVACDIVSVAYQAGTWGYKVDGGSTQTVTSTPTSGGTTQQNAVIYKTTIPLSGSNTALQLGFQSAGLTMMVSLLAFRYATNGIGQVILTAPSGSATDYATSAGATSASPVVSATPGISAPDDKMQAWTQVTNAHNTAGAGWPLNPNLAVICHYANAIGRGGNPTSERAALEKLCRALRTGNPNISFVFLINNIPDQLYQSSSYEDTNFVADRAAQFKGVIFDVAKSVNGAILDIDQKWGETAFANGFLPANNVHPTGTGATSSDGHYDIAQALYSIL